MRVRALSREFMVSISCESVPVGVSLQLRFLFLTETHSSDACIPCIYRAIGNYPSISVPDPISPFRISRPSLLSPSSQKSPSKRHISNHLKITICILHPDSPLLHPKILIKAVPSSPAGPHIPPTTPHTPSAVIDKCKS